LTSATAWRDAAPLHMWLSLVASILLHLPLVMVLQPQLLPEKERFSQRAIEVTLDRALAPTALPAPQAGPEPGRILPSGSIDLVRTAAAPRLPDAVPLRPAQSSPQAVLPLPLAMPPALEQSLPLPQAPPVVTAHDPAFSKPSSRARDALDRVQAPPPRQSERQAAPRPAPQHGSNAAAKASAAGEPARGSDQAARASQHDARQDYVLNVVRKLSHMRFLADSGSAPKTRGVVIARLTVARDGALADLSLAEGSGSAGVDRSVLEAIRTAAPFAPLPKDFADNRFTFILPINYTREL
jgi:periplasmic protein TonB